MARNFNPRWSSNLNRPTKVKCKNELCQTIVDTTRSTAANQGKYCDDCRIEAVRLNDKRGRPRQLALRKSRRNNQNVGPTSKLSLDDVAMIQATQHDYPSTIAIAKAYRISYTSVYNVLKGWVPKNPRIGSPIQPDDVS